MKKKEQKIAKVAKYPLMIENITFVQEGNSCSDVDSERLEVKFDDAGGGYFYILKTEQFAFDSDGDDMVQLIGMLKDVCDSNDIHWNKECDRNQIIEDIKKENSAPKTPKKNKQDKGKITTIDLNKNEDKCDINSTPVVNLYHGAYTNYPTFNLSPSTTTSTHIITNPGFNADATN